MRIFAFLTTLLFALNVYSEDQIKVGMGAILSGDIAVFGQNDLRSATLYLKHFSRHNIKLIAEDARLSSKDGLTAYQKLINIDKVDLIIAAGTSNGVIAAKNIIEKTKTPTLMASTGGSNVDQASSWIFRIGNSDILNGTQQAEHLIKLNHRKIALITELTEYTMDISEHFKKRYKILGGTLILDEQFKPGETDFKTFIFKLLRKQPEAIFLPSQTGTVLGVFLKQLRQINKDIPIFTTMVAAPNPDAHRVAGKYILGVNFMDPEFADSKQYHKFEELYIKEYGEPPTIPFHGAAVIDSLEHLQDFLDQNKQFDNQKFKTYLTNSVKDYCGYMGCYSLDDRGHSNLGFKANTITKLIQ